MEHPTNGWELVTLLLCPSVDASPGHVPQGLYTVHRCGIQVQCEIEAGKICHGGLADVLRGISVQTQRADWLVTEA